MGKDLDHYAVLGVGPIADYATIRGQYRRLVKRYHPDVNKGEEAWAAEKFLLVTRSYEVLSDPLRRRQYDKERRAELTPSAVSGPGPTAHKEGERYEEEAEAWKVACRSAPNLKEIALHLAQIAPRLAIAFKEAILKSNDFSSANDIAGKLKADFFAKYLDTAPELLSFHYKVHER